MSNGIRPRWIASPARGTRATTPPPTTLEIGNLDVHYGRAHAVQGVSLRLAGGVLAVVGRNGMGKTSLCNAVTGLVPASGSVRLAGRELLGLPPHEITDLGIGYVPQGRRVWPSLSVDEHLRLASRTARRGPWTVERVYSLFPRLAERRASGAAQLSGGEQQMLAIGRALLFNPLLLVMDEPTEGLAPVIVDQVASMLKSLAAERSVAVLLVEQNLGVAIDVADTIAVMVNGRVARVLPATELDADTALQHRLLGVGANGNKGGPEGGGDAPDTADPGPDAAAPRRLDVVDVLTVRRADDRAAPQVELPRTIRTVTAWNHADVDDVASDRPLGLPPAMPGQPDAATSLPADRAPRVVEQPVAATANRAAYVAGTFDTKGRELLYLRQCIDRLGIRTVTVDLSTAGAASIASVHPREVARHHPGGERAVFTDDRGSSVVAMAVAFERFILTRRDVGGLISAGGSGGTSLATPAMRALPVGVPKVMVSTVASGDVRAYVGPSDICMMYSVTDVQGINRISQQVLANAAHALAGMIAHASAPSTEAKPAIGLTMFGVTTPCVQQVARLLEDEYDCLVFHATGTGGQSMEKLADSGLLAGVVDVSTTEIADELGGGVFSAGPARLDAIVRSGVPYVGSCGALDMVNFHAIDTVPERFKARNLYRHNAQVTLMRTTAAENVAIGEFIAAKLNRMEGPVRFLIPEGGVSMLDAPGKPFWDPAADRALFDTIQKAFRPAANRKLVRLPHHVNDPQFADALVAAFREVVSATARH